MDRRNQQAGILSPIFSFNKHTDIYNENHLTSHITHDIDIHNNASKTHIFSIPGSHNQGWMFNDALFNVTNIFHKPIFLSMSQHSLLYYSSLVFMIVFFILMILLYFVHYHHRLPSPQRQQHALDKQEKQCCYFVPLSKHQAQLQYRNFFLARDRTRKAKSFIKQSKQENCNDNHHKSVAATGVDTSQEANKVTVSISLYMYTYGNIDPHASKKSNSDKSSTS